MRLPQPVVAHLDRPQRPDEVWSQMMDYWSTTGQLSPTTVAPYQRSLTGADFQSLAYQASGFEVPTGGETDGDGSLSFDDWTASSWEPAGWADDRGAGSQGWQW